MWLICMEVQRSRFGVKVMGYMGEPGYMGAQYQARGRAWDVVRIYGLHRSILCKVVEAKSFRTTLATSFNTR